MFKRFREKIERALERKEAQRPLSRDDLDRLLHEMRQELIQMKSRIPLLQKEVKQLDQRAAQQIQRAELAHHKAKEAEAAGRADEVHRAMEATRDSLSQAEESRRQADEAREEVSKLEAEYAEKLEQLKYAERNRSALLARSRRTKTSEKLDEAIRGPQSGLKRFERAEEDIEAAEDMVEAEREVAEALGERSSARELETDYELRKLEAAKEADEIERRLLELKKEIKEE
jgi:phage shock protein A